MKVHKLKEYLSSVGEVGLWDVWSSVCGFDNELFDDLKITDKWKHVTCKRCLKKRSRK